MNFARMGETERRKLADRLIGRWTNKSCDERYWDVTKIDDYRYKAVFWYQDVGIDGEEQFSVKFTDAAIELQWNIKNTSKTATSPYYVEKISGIGEDKYVVFENNYRNFYDSWEVKRCPKG